MDVTFRENEPYYGSNVGSGISLSPLDEQQERGSEGPVLVLAPTSANSPSTNNSQNQGEENDGVSDDNSCCGDEDDATGHLSLPSHGEESEMHEDQGNDIKEISGLKHHLAQEFEVKDLGHLRYFLGIEVLRGPKEQSKDKSGDSSIDKMYEIFSKLLEQQQLKAVPETIRYALEPNPVKLSGPNNYVNWARHARLILSSHGYENLLDDEEEQKSGDTHPKMINDRVLVWLLGSMEPIVRQQVEIISRVSEVWTALEKQFAGKSNKMQATRIMEELTHLNQGTKSVTEYAGELKRLYRDLHYYHPFQPVDKKDMAIHHK
ncbi:hypothetical protein QYE76_022776, partial [Lolium multiflorum]